MGFFSRMLNTKKVKELKEDVKNFRNDIDNKFDISEKIDTVKDTISHTAEKIENKIEYALDGKISFDKFVDVEMKIGEIKTAEKVEKSEKLLKLSVDFAEKEGVRQIISGIAKSYSPEEVVGKKVLFVTNIEPRKIFGLESNGMILGVKDKEGNFTLVSPENNVNPGVRIG